MSNHKVFRKEGYLTETTQVIYPKQLIFYDTETYIIEDKNGYVEFPLRLGTMIYIELDNNLNIVYRIIHKFKSSLEFIELLDKYSRKKLTLYIFAHNTGFDIRVLRLPHLFNDMGYSSEVPIINERAFIWDVKTDKGKYLFLDTANYGVTSVSQLGDDLNFPKIEVDLKTQDENKLFEYNLRDVEIIEKFMLEYLYFLRDNNLGTFKITLASQSLSTYRYKFMENKPYIHINQDAINLERKSYHGGRVECFKIGNFMGETYYNLDVNSMYPYAMKSIKLPTKLKGYSGKCPVEYMPARLARSYVIADVIISTDIPAYPIINKGKLIFPIGTFRTQLHHEELEYASKNNHIKQVISCAVYEYAPLFDKYVDFFYAAKQKYSSENNLSYRYITKLFLNSLYGKFGQTNPIREEIGKTEFDGIFREQIIDTVTHKHYQEVCWFGNLIKEYREGETNFSIPAIAGTITAIARMILWKYIEIARIENLFYCDTDSLIVNQKGYDNLKEYIDPLVLGLLKLDKQSNNLRIFNCKDYQFGKEKRRKGIPSKAKLIQQNRWKYLQFQGFLSWLNEGGNSGAKGYYTEKRRVSTYNKGKILTSGIIKPYVFDYIEDKNVMVCEQGVGE